MIANGMMMGWIGRRRYLGNGNLFDHAWIITGEKSRKGPTSESDPSKQSQLSPLLNSP